MMTARELAPVFARAPEALRDKRGALGFDGFRDVLTRPVRDAETKTHFSTIAEFGEYLASKAGKSGSITLDVVSERVGGNMPLVSKALGAFGLAADLYGMLGAPGPAPLFASMPECLRLHGFCAPGEATALEFDDGKLFFMPERPLAQPPWALLRAAHPDVAERFGAADFAALLNWSELDFSQALWESVYEDCFAHAQADFSRFVFFDLCDCTPRGDGEIRRVLELIGRFGEKRRAILSLNENEALVCARATLPGVQADPGEIAARLGERFGIAEVVVHTYRESICAHGGGLARVPTRFVARPMISTGGGDNFNAGYILASLLGLDAQARLLTANMTSNYYIRHGQSAAPAGLAAFAETYDAD